MKRNLYIIIVLCLVLGCLSGCSNKPTVNTQNIIESKNLTQDQEDIVSLLSSDNQEILLFDFQADDTFHKMEFWVELYENGELIDRPSGSISHSNELSPLNGQFAVLINHNDGIGFTFTTKTDNSKITHSSEIINIDSSGLGRGYGPITDPITLEPEKEIVLYTSVYSAGSMATYSDQQIYIEEPELLDGYPYAFMIKCKFE